jgi:DNA-binding MarR family transcriptional regulator
MKEDHRLKKKSIPQKPVPYTEKQGQYLAFIYHYTKVNRCPPAERDIQRFFMVSPPSVHRMLIDLQKKKLISRLPGQPRTITVLLHLDQLPILLDVN